MENAHKRKEKNKKLTSMTVPEGRVPEHGSGKIEENREERYSGRQQIMSGKRKKKGESPERKGKSGVASAGGKTCPGRDQEKD